MTPFVRTLCVLALAASLGACAGAGVSPEAMRASQPNTPLDVWPDRVRIESAPDEVLLAPHASGLSQTQARALSDFYARWAGAEGGEIVIKSPGGSPGAYRTGTQAQAFLVGEGVPAGMVRMAGYEADAPNAPVVVGFLRNTVVTPDCSAYWGGLTQTKDNTPYYSFGCATASNLAAQVANPADLQRPRVMTPADAQRRDTVMGKYRAGQPTSAEPEANGRGAISTAVN